MIGVGTLTSGIAARVGADGTVHQGAFQLGWRVRSGNDWLTPGADSPTRRSRPHAAPIVHTALRISGGDAIQRVYAVGEGDGAVVVLEVENASPEAIAVGFVVQAPGALSVDETVAYVDGVPTLAFTRRPGAVEDGGLVVFPVPHRTTVRVALTTATALDVRALPDVAAVERAWDAMLDRGMRTELPESLQSEVDAARADLLLAPVSADAFVLLEAWGLDTEAIEMWARMRTRDRRAAKRAAPDGVLGETWRALLGEVGTAIEVLPGFRVEWLGQHLAAHDMPLRRGPCSFAVRWHGARPALLWDVPAGSLVCAPALDPAWSSSEPVGETLLAEPPASLLSMGARAAVTGATVEAPDQFT